MNILRAVRRVTALAMLAGFWLIFSPYNTEESRGFKIKHHTEITHRRE